MSKVQYTRIDETTVIVSLGNCRWVAKTDKAGKRVLATHLIAPEYLVGRG